MHHELKLKTENATWFNQDPRHLEHLVTPTGDTDISFSAEPAVARQLEGHTPSPAIVQFKK